MNKFKESLVNQANGFKGLLPATTEGGSQLEDYRQNKLNTYRQILDNPKIHHYFHNIVAAIMMAQYETYEFAGINIPYRFKSPQSTKNKLDSRIRKAHIEFDKNQRMHISDMGPIVDIFAMKVISKRRPPVFHSTDPEINALIEERKKNQGFLDQMQQFKGKLVENEYTKPENYVLKYECTKLEYYEKCKELITRLKDLIDPRAVNVINHYNEQLLDIDNRLEVINATGPSSFVDKDDLTDGSLNFFKLLEEYESRFYDKSELAILTKQFLSLFENNEVFKKLGISIKHPENPVEEKRTENGYESNFICIDTLLGTIECQLQTEHQFEYGNYGFAAHSKLEGKAVKLVKIPDNVEDKKLLNKFVQKVREISPKGYSARMDSNEQGRVMIQKFDDYQNYKGLVSQVAKGHPLERLLRVYFSRLYALRHDIFKASEKTMGFNNLDIEEYLSSKEFEDLKQKIKDEKFNIQDFEDLEQ